MYTKVIGEQQVQILSPSFSISPSNEDYVLNISANGSDFSPLFAVSAGVTRLVSNVAPGSYYKLVGNQSEVVINWQRMCVTDGGGGSFDPTVLDPYWTSAQTKDYVDGAVSGISVDLSDYYTSAQTEDAITSKNYVTSGEVETQIVSKNYITSADTANFVTSAQVETQIVEKNYASAEIELPIAAAVNDLKSNIEARLDQQYYKKKEVNDIAARKVEAGQVDAQIKNYVDPAIAEVNDTIADKELPVSAALNELNQKISEISGGSGSDMSAYWTSAQTEEAISAATAGKADVANISGRTQESNYYYFPWFNNQGIITGDTRVYKATLTMHMSDGSVSNADLFKDNNYGIPGIYVASKPGTAGQIAKSDGHGFTWANDDKVSSTSVSTIWKGTQTEYDAITTKDPNTFYIIVNN